ncbi:MAG: hypothetical protein HC801_10820, partial [Nitrospira sp.]|nr:hypothetical protein [Nitrospira sp.]
LRRLRADRVARHVLIDGVGAIRWLDISYQPFMETKFLLEEAKRLLGLSGARLSDAGLRRLARLSTPLATGEDALKQESDDQGQQAASNRAGHERRTFAVDSALVATGLEKAPPDEDKTEHCLAARRVMGSAAATEARRRIARSSV